MIRSILSVIAGFAVWSVLWIGTNGALVAALPESFNEDGSAKSAGILLLILVASVVFSIVSGFVTALVAQRSEVQHALALGVVLLAVGIFVQIQYWDLMPVWYHLSFLVLLVPASLVGGSLRSGHKLRLSPA